MNSKKILVAAAVFYFANTEAQQSQYFTQKENYRFGLAENLYQTKVYNAAQYEYARQYFYNANLEASRKEAAQFFDQVIGVILQKNHAEQGLSAFLKEYPNSAYFAQANLPLADYYLAQKDFEAALKTLKKVNQYQLTREENTEYILKLGYAKFMTGDSKGAIDALEEAYKTADASQKGDIAYMLGHLQYTKGQNSEAFLYFDTIKDNAKFSKLVRPYYVQMFYNDKDYDKAIDEGTALLNEDLSEAYKAEVHKIIGESYFMKGNYAAAYPHLKDYLSVQQNPSDNDLYEMGFVAAQLQKYDEAVSYYNQLLNSNSALAQNAYYQLGNAYLSVNKKQEALTAFRSSYQMNYDATVKKLAHEQYAKLSYDIGNPFDNATQVIQDYISQYPQDASTRAMRSLLVKSYLYSGNFKETLAAIDKLPNSSPETDKVDQEVSYLLGTEEFNKGNFSEAEKYFLRSLEFNINKEFNNQANYWLGQVYYQKENYPAAVSRYESILTRTFPEQQQLPYDLAYAYFKQKKFDQAEKYFREYLKNPKTEFKNDAQLRLADISFANNDLDEAIAIYDQNADATDYTLYQKALALGFKDSQAAKITALKQLLSTYPTSEYSDDAAYEIGVAYSVLEDYGNANSYFERAIKSSSDRDLIANASIYRAQNFIDQNQNERALTELRSLGEQYRNTPFAEKIVWAARPIFMKNGDVAGYQSFAKNVGINVDAKEIDEINLATAKQYFAKKEYKNAIAFYEKYLTQNPNEAILYQAKYELGESYYQTNDFAKALLMLQEISLVNNEYQTEAQTRLAQIYLAQNNSSEAKKYLEQIKNASDLNVRNFASVELMKIYAAEKNFAAAEPLANAVIANSKNSSAVIETAKVIKARSLMSNGKDNDARSAYSALEKSSNTEVAAEALFAKALYQNKAKAYKSSNETIFKMANNYASEEYWGARALVVMAKNYIGLKDNYQASYTVDQIISNYSDFPEIVAEAREIKKQIKK